MSVRLVVTAAAAALVVAAPALAEQPPPALARAEAKTAQASSVRVHVLMSMRVAGQAMAFDVSGFERLKAHQASFVLDMSKLSPSVGKVQMLAIGSRYYVHYPYLDTLRASKPGIRPWIVTDSASAAGFDPWSMVGVQSSLRAASGYRLLPASGGLTRYGFSITLRKAIGANPQLQQLLDRAGSLLSGALDTPVPVVLSVGGDGYLHRAVERITMTIAGESLALTVDARLSDFGADPGPIAAPPADQVMTLARFKQLARG